MEEGVQKVTSKIQYTSVPFGTRTTTQVNEQDGEQFSNSEALTAHKKKKRVKRKKKQDDLIPLQSFDIPGVSKIIISPVVQRSVECAVGEDVTSENPWKYVSKDNLELHAGSSEFLPIKNELLSYPRQELLLGYIPDESREYDEFYICLTEPAEEAVTEIIDRIRKQQEEKLNNSIFKTAKPWKTMGSELEVDLGLVKKNRPLLSMEIGTKYPIMVSKCQFRLKLVQHVKDGYAELAPVIHPSIYKKRIDSCVQITPTSASNEAQTFCTYPTNAWTQYEYKYEPIETLSEEFEEHLQSFAANEEGAICDMIYVNSYINFYYDDYLDLVRDQKYTRVPKVADIKEYITFVEEKLCKGREIASLSWHPMWTGTVAIAYSENAPNGYKKYQSHTDVVTSAIYGVIPVLLWSFKDNLNPKLYLETPREINVIEFCPHNENILVGGCTNGQIIVWDIRNKLQELEKEEKLFASTQPKYRLLMYSLVKWMKNIKDLKVVRNTVISDLDYSHKSAVTSISWLSPFREMSKYGHFREISNEENRRSLQFMTSSKDGTVLSWDLLAKPVVFTSVIKAQRKFHRLRKLPTALCFDVSPLRSLNKLLKPFFTIKMFEPNSSRPLPISSFSMETAVIQYEERNPDPHREFNVTDRILYKPKFSGPTQGLIYKLIAGTIEGDFVTATWQGYEFDEFEEVVSIETCKIENFAKYHDGPIVSLSRSELFPDLCLTVGGKVFALWKNELVGKPVMWRRAKCRYTQGVWDADRPSSFRLTRSDGSLEIWHLGVRSDRYLDLKVISGKGLAGTFAHPRRMKQNILGIADSSSALRLFYEAPNLTQVTEVDKSSTYKLCNREVDRKMKFVKWQERWKVKNVELLKAKKEKELLIQQQKEDRIKKEQKELKEKKEQLEKEAAERAALLTRPKLRQHAEWGRHWVVKEKERLSKVLLKKKGLDIDLLEKHQLPLIELAEEKQKKKVKQEERLNNAKKIFDDAVTLSFPDAVEVKPPATPDPYGGGDSVEVKVEHFEKYCEIAETCQEFIKKNQYFCRFDWLQVIKAGKERRRVLDGYYGRYSHKYRIVREKRELAEKLAAAAAPPAPLPTSKRKRIIPKPEIIVAGGEPPKPPKTEGTNL